MLLYKSINNLQGYTDSSLLKVNLNITIYSYSQIYLNGRNGSGKTTLLKSILLSYLFTDGYTFSIFNGTIYLGELTYIFKTPITVYEWIKQWQNSLELNNKLILTYLYYFNLKHKLHKPFSSLSKGQLQKLFLLKVICSSKVLWLLDECNSGLDLISKKKLNFLFSYHQRKGGSILFTDHSYCQNSTDILNLISI